MEQSNSRYIIGIDLGTSTCALSYVDTLKGSEHEGVIQQLDILQLESPGKEVALELLPSFLYISGDDESAELKTTFSSDEGSTVGTLAKKYTTEHPERVISSAKSWLVSDQVEQASGFLPWGSQEIAADEKLSAIEASAQYLRHLKNVWNATVGSFSKAYRLEKQQVYIAVPASFDEAAQERTLLAAQLAEYSPETCLIEEPQAAFYCYLDQHREGLDPNLKSLLVCDIGGGTSDFSFFQCRSATEIVREKVSNHILLGGDNIDLAIAHRLETQVDDSITLSQKQWRHLIAASRILKERVLSHVDDDTDEELHLTIPGEGGASLFANNISLTIKSSELQSLVTDGFFPLVSQNEDLISSSSGLKEWGLPYASDSRISVHIADFLSEYLEEKRKIDAILFNGGTLTPISLQKQICKLIESWQGDAPVAIHNTSLPLAVSRGAAVFGKLKREQSQKLIKGGYARSLYLELEHAESAKKQLVCILPRGFEGDSLRLSDHTFRLRAGIPVQFKLLYSPTSNELVGDIVSLNDNEHTALPPLRTVLARSEQKLKQLSKESAEEHIEVQLSLRINDLGLLQLFLDEVGENGKQWELKFNLRTEGTTSSTNDDKDKPQLQYTSKVEHQIRELIAAYYGKRKKDANQGNPKQLLKQLEECLSIPKQEWNTTTLRALWSILSPSMTRKGRSLSHETTWCYLAGYLLRPGIGVEFDDTRVNALFRMLQLGLSFPKDKSALTQWYIMWRRVAGGLTIEQQQKLREKLYSKVGKDNESPELIRLIGSLERLDEKQKIKFGNYLIKRITGRKTTGIEHYIWALGRLCARIPLYASPQYVIDTQIVESWFTQLLELDWSIGDLRGLEQASLQAMRKTNDRSRDIGEAMVSQVISRLQERGTNSEQLDLLRNYHSLSTTEQSSLFGEELPSGLILL